MSRCLPEAPKRRAFALHRDLPGCGRSPYFPAQPPTHSPNGCAAQVAVAESPQAWWRHAVRCVLAERRSLLGAALSPRALPFSSILAAQPADGSHRSNATGRQRSIRKSKVSSQEAVQKLSERGRRLDWQRHARAYGALRSRAGRLAWVLMGVARGAGGAAAAVAAVEAHASALDAALMRWRVWAHGARRRVRAPHHCMSAGFWWPSPGSVPLCNLDLQGLECKPPRSTAWIFCIVCWIKCT